MFGSILKCVVVCAAVFAAASCGPQPKGGGVAEKISENTYRNEPFGLTVTAPDGWFVMDNAQTKKLMDMGADIAAPDDQRLKAGVRASMQNSSNLFTFFEHAPGAPVEFNASVIGMTENLAMAPGVKTGKDYFFHVKRMLEQSNVATEFVGDYKTRKIGGQNFDQMDVRMTTNGVTVSQSYYAAKHGEYAVGFVQSYINDEQRKATDVVIDSVKLDW